MRTLFVTADPPYPATSGAPLRNWQNVTLAAELGPVAVLSIGHGRAEADALPGVERWEHVVVERSGDVPPGFPLIAGAMLAAVLPRLDALLAAFRPAVVVFENLWFERMPAALRVHGERVVFDSHNVYAAVAEELGGDVAAVRALERDALASADDVWLCSTDDLTRVQRAYALDVPPRVVPNGIDTDFYASIRSGRSRRLARKAPGLIFVGSYWYEPNRFAAEALIDDILPRVRSALGDGVRLYLVGAAPTDAMRAAAERDPAIVVAGRVADVRPYLTLADVVVAPLRHGGGTRLKLLEAFAAQRPVVATAKAAEGLDVRDGEQLLLRESADDTAAAIEALWREPERARALAAAAYAFVDATYSWNALRSTVRGALATPASAPFTA